MNEYYHKFKHTNERKLKFYIGVEVVLAKNGNLKYRAYDLVDDDEPIKEILELRRCPLTRDNKPSIRGIEKQVKEELSGWVPRGLPQEKSPILR